MFNCMKQLDPKAVWLFFLGDMWTLIIAITFVGLIFIQALFGGGEDLTQLPFSLFDIGGIFSFFIFFLVTISYVIARLKYHFYKYELGKNGFRKELGIIYKKYVTIPYGRIQNVDIHRGLLARFLGLSNLRIHTAGVGGVAASEGSLPGVSKEVAEQLRDELIARSRVFQVTGL